MSGGAFDYEDSRIDYLADKLFDEICSEERMKKDTDFGYYKKSDEFINKTKLTYCMLRVARCLMHRIDWVISGDDSEEDFEPCLKKDLESLKDEYGIEANIKYTKNGIDLKFKNMKRNLNKKIRNHKVEEDY